MTNPTGPTAVPPFLAAATLPALPRRPWQTGIAPRYIGLFLWIVYFDELPRWTLAVGGLIPSVLGALVAGVLCYLLLYHGPATWGYKSGLPLESLGTSTFGAAGAPWLTGVLVGLAQVVWFAVATFYAVELTFEGLVSARLMNPASLQPIQLAGLSVPSPLFLVTSLAWSFAAALVGHYLLQIISALMNIYPMFMALLLAAAVALTLPDVSRFRPLAVDPATGAPVAAPGLQCFCMMIELVFGFFALAGVLAADWGAVSETQRDVRLGGWVAVAGAAWTVATLALLTVAGALGRLPDKADLAVVRGIAPLDLSFRGAVLHGIGGTLGATTLLVFGLGSLGPTCYSAYLFGHRFFAAWPQLPRIRWTLAGTTAAWLLIASGGAGRLEFIFSLMGAVFAPLAAALSADYLRQRGAWGGGRAGVNLPGVIAWAVGLAVGLAPLCARAAGWNAAARFQPAAVYAYISTFIVYIMLSITGAEAPFLPDAAAQNAPGTALDHD